MSVSGITLAQWRADGKCLRCGRHPAIDRPYLCRPCQVEIKSAKKRLAKAAGR